MSFFWSHIKSNNRCGNKCCPLNIRTLIFFFILMCVCLMPSPPPPLLRQPHKIQFTFCWQMEMTEYLVCISLDAGVFSAFFSWCCELPWFIKDSGGWTFYCHPTLLSSTPGDRAVRVKRSATYQEHTVQIMKLANCEKKPVVYLKNLLTCPLNLILE